MATEFPITSFEVQSGFQTDASNDDIDGLIALADQADECLRRNEVAQGTGQLLKRLFVRHALTLMRDGGPIESEKAVSGASRDYGRIKGNTGYLDTLRRLDRWGCVYGLLTAGDPVQFRSAGRRPENPRTY